MHPKPSRVRRMRSFAVSFLFVAGIVNYLDRTSFSIANTSVRADLGLSGTQIGALLSVFSLAYGVAQLPIGLMLDRIGSRLILAAGMFVWSLRCPHLAKKRCRHSMSRRCGCHRG